MNANGSWGERDSLFDAVVVGGGLCGLATAAELLRLAPDARVICLEAQVRAGGFVIDGGPAGFIDKHGAVRRLARSLELDGHMMSSSGAHQARWVKRDGRLHRFPASLAGLVGSDLLSAAGKLRLLAEPFRPRPAEGEARDETVRAFATRRLGREAAEILVDPIVSGIYAADAGQVSVASSLPQLVALERQGRSLLRMFLGSTGTVRPLVSFRGGCQRLIDALTSRLGDRVLCGGPVESIVRRKGSADGDHAFEVRLGDRMIRARTVVSAAPALAASRYLRALDPEVAWQLAQIRYASVAVVALGYRKGDLPHPLAGFGYLVPRCEGSPVLGVQWSSSMYPGELSPAGTCLVRLFLGGAYHPTLAAEPAEELARLARDEVASALGASAPPLVCHVERHLEAMPQYLPEHERRVQEIEDRLGAHPGLFVGGNGLRGLGMDAVAFDAEKQAAAATAFLRRSTAAPPSETTLHSPKER